MPHEKLPKNCRYLNAEKYAKFLISLGMHSTKREKEKGGEGGDGGSGGREARTARNMVATKVNFKNFPPIKCKSVKNGYTA